MNALIEVNGVPARVIQSDADKREESMLSLLKAAQTSLLDIASIKDVYRVTTEVRKMLAAAKAFELSVSCQRLAAETSIRCLFALGMSIRSAYTGPKATDWYNINRNCVSWATANGIARGNASLAISLSTYTLAKVSAALKGCSQGDIIPTPTFIRDYLNRGGDGKCGSPIEYSTSVFANRAAKTNTKTIETSHIAILEAIQQLRVASYRLRKLGVKSNLIPTPNSETELREEYAKSLLAFRQLKRNMRELSKEMKVAKKNRAMWSGSYAEIRARNVAA